MSDHDTTIRKWVAMNRSFQLSEQSNASSDNESNSQCQEEISYASKHRKLVLDAATRFANGWTNSSTKRKATIATFKTTKKPKTESRKSRASLVLGASDPAKKKSRATQRTIAKKQKVINEPVKQYLQPTKMNKLNQSKKTPSIAGKTQRVVKRVISEASKNVKNEAKQHKAYAAANYEPDGQMQGYMTRDAGPFDAISAAKTKSISEMDEDVIHHDLSLHNQNSSDRDLSITNTSMQTSPISYQPSTPQNIQPSPDVRRLSASISTTGPLTPQLPSDKVQPFLRQILPAPVSPTKYSPIPRLTLYLRVPTCFRIAEAIRLLKPQTVTATASVPVSPCPPPPTVIELFATVANISTKDTTTTIQFADVFFPHRPPYIMGTMMSSKRMDTNNHQIYRAIIRPSPNISQAFVSDNSSKATSTTNSYAGVAMHVQIETIAESSSSEIEYVRGIVDPEGVEEEKRKRENSTALSTS